jgi:hypothetical protein
MQYNQEEFQFNKGKVVEGRLVFDFGSTSKKSGYVMLFLFFMYLTLIPILALFLKAEGFLGLLLAWVASITISHFYLLRQKREGDRFVCSIEPAKGQDKKASIQMSYQNKTFYQGEFNFASMEIYQFEVMGRKLLRKNINYHLLFRFDTSVPPELSIFTRDMTEKTMGNTIPLAFGGEDKQEMIDEAEKICCFLNVHSQSN